MHKTAAGNMIEHCDSRFEWDPRRRKLKIWPGNLWSQRRLPCRQVNPSKTIHNHPQPPTDRISKWYQHPTSKIQAFQIFAQREDMKTLKTHEHRLLPFPAFLLTFLTISFFLPFSCLFSPLEAKSALVSLTVTTVSSQYLRFSICSRAPCRFWTALTSWHKRPRRHPEMSHHFFFQRPRATVQAKDLKLRAAQQAKHRAQRRGLSDSDGKNTPFSHKHLLFWCCICYVIAYFIQDISRNHWKCPNQMVKILQRSVKVLWILNAFRLWWIELWEIRKAAENRAKILEIVEIFGK